MDFRDKTTAEQFYWVLFLGIFGLSMYFRLPFIFMERLWPDEALYAWSAKRIFLHPELMFSKEIAGFHPPLFSALMSLWHFILPPKMACHSMIFFTNLLGIVVIYFLGRRIRGHFLGCFAAMMLSFNPFYFLISNYILIDGVLSVFMILFFYTLARTSQPKITSRDFWLGFAVMGLILLKWSAGLVLPLIVLYYLLAFPDWTLRQRLAKISIPLIFGAVLVALLLWRNYAVWGTWIPQVFSSSNDFYKQPFYFYLDLLFRAVIDWPLVPFFLAGMWMAFTGRDYNYWAHGLWIVLGLIVISSMSNKDMRFIGPLIPSVILIIGMTVEKFLSWLEENRNVHIFKPLFVIIAFSLVLGINFPKITNYTKYKANTYIGYETAGDYVKAKVAQAPDTIVWAGSPRMIRYYSDVNFTEFGGRVAKIPESQAEFLEASGKIPSDILLIVDAWEWAQPKWIHPLKEEHLKFLSGQGFRLEQVVYRDIYVSKRKMSKEPVVWCFRKAAHTEINNEP